MFGSGCTGISGKVPRLANAQQDTRSTIDAAIRRGADIARRSLATLMVCTGYCMTLMALNAPLPNFAEPRDLDAILHNVELLTPLITASADAAEYNGRFDVHMLEGLIGAGLFRMAMPPRWNAPDLSLAAQADVLERLGRVDAATAWLVAVGSHAGETVRNIPDHLAFDLFPHPDMAQCVAFGSGAVGESIAGAYRLSGGWQGLAGVANADVAALAFAVHEQGTATGETRVAVVPVSHLRAAPEPGCALRAAGLASAEPAAGHLVVPEAHTYAGPTEAERLRLRVLAAAVGTGLMARFAHGEDEAPWHAARTFLIEVARGGDGDSRLHRARLAAEYSARVAVAAGQRQAADAATRRATLDAQTLLQLSVTL